MLYPSPRTDDADDDRPGSTALRSIARWVAAHDRTPAPGVPELLVERAFVMLASAHPPRHLRTRRY